MRMNGLDPYQIPKYKYPSTSGNFVFEFFFPLKRGNLKIKFAYNKKKLWIVSLEDNEILNQESRNKIKNITFYIK